MNKILFVTTDRRAAQLGAQALQRISPGSRFTWTQTSDSAVRWLQANQDAAAVVIEAERHGDAAVFRDQVRRLGLGVRVVVTAPGKMGTWLSLSVTVPGPRSEPAPQPKPLDKERRAEKLTVALQGRLLELEGALDESRRTQHAEQQAAADRLAQRESEFAAALAGAAANQAAVERRLADAIVRAEQARQRAETDLKAAALREGALKQQIAEAAAARETLQQNLAASEAARIESDRRHAGRVAEALARLNDLQTRYDAVLAIHATARVNLEQQLADAEAAREQLASESADLAVREAALRDQLARETAAREDLQRTLASAEAAHAEAERRHAAAREEASARIEDLRRAYDAAVADHVVARAEHAAAREALERDLAAAESARTDGERRHAAELADAERRYTAELQDVERRRTAELEAAEHRRTVELQEAARLHTTELADAERRQAAALAESAARMSELQRTYDAALTQHARVRAGFEQQLTDADAHRQNLESAVAAAAEREAHLSGQLAAETAARAAVERKLADAETARLDADRRHAAELAEAAAHLSDLERKYDEAIAEHDAARSALERQLAAAASEIDRLTSDAAAAAARETQLARQLVQDRSAREALEDQLAAAEGERQEANRRHAIELAEAAARLSDLQRAYDTARSEHAAARAALEESVAGLQRQLADAAISADAAAHAAADVREHLESEVADMRTRAAAARRRVIELALRRRQRSRTELAAKDEELHRAEAELARVTREFDQARESLDHLGVSFAALERVAGENAAERARLESIVADRDAQLRAHVERHLAAERRATDTIAALRHELHAASARAATLQHDAERAGVLQDQLEQALREGRRLFERAPYGLCRFMPDGAFVKANHSFARLLGYRKGEDLRGVSLGTVFECAPDLRWVIDLSTGSATTATIETSLKAKDGRRVEVRLHALSHADGTVDVAVQDLTGQRALEARLREAQRMEAVGRLASEVAVTCDMVLRDVRDSGRAWLAGIDDRPDIRQQGEMLLGEVSRAAGFLRDFSVYGKKQLRALQPVSVQQVIRNLAPVLKRVAGDDIEWVLPKLSRPILVDVDTERVERVLVNVASYARERMPRGGRIKVDVTTAVVGHDFTAKYPNVRPGAHALITIAEITRGDRAAAWVEPAGDYLPSASDRTGVDLGALMSLLGNCGGHLWISAERTGNMTLKVHLPRRIAAEDEQVVPVTKAQRVRQLAGWFRH